MKDDDFNKKFDGMSFSTSWVQPMNPFMNTYGTVPIGPTVNANEVYSRLSTLEELARLDFLETQLQAMSYYPDAETIFAKIAE